jgi:1-acyl-sn-glycerol-3-phosphate acyltransferase
MLLEARKHRLLERAYAIYARRLLRATFARLRVGGAPWPAGEEAGIAFLNHAAWWDPIVAFHLSHEVFRRDGYGIMEARQLERFPFFRQIGCFGASDRSLEDARTLAEHAVALLAGAPRRTLWIFPEGALRPAHAPLHFRSGLARIALAAPWAALVPVALRYEFRDEQRPECLVRVGERVERRAGEGALALGRRLERALGATLALLDADLLAGNQALAAYETRLEGRGSVSDRFERLRALAARPGR